MSNRKKLVCWNQRCGKRLKEGQYQLASFDDKFGDEHIIRLCLSCYRKRFG